LSIVKDLNLKKRLYACKDLVIDAAEELNSKIPLSEVYTIKPESIINGNVHAKELENVYNFRMVKKNTPGRKIYDKIFSAPSHGICPLCCHRVVKTLDHYLPKSYFPRLSVTPINLIPSCSDCNNLKRLISPSCPEEELLHPYYDDIGNDIWLKADVVHSSPPTLNFYVNPPDSWPDLLAMRVKNHFGILFLNNLYSIQAGVELSNILNRLESIFLKSGPDWVKIHLEEEAISREKANKNSWQTAMYKAISKDNWFCEGGFKSLIH
jgi:hypothetical protein